MTVEQKVRFDLLGIEVIENAIGSYDFLYPDGSKGYSTFCDRVIHIERPEVVSYVEEILSGGYVGWGYMSVLQDLQESGKITTEEKISIMKILD
jgi:hypothetical protein